MAKTTTTTTTQPSVPADVQAQIGAAIQAASTKKAIGGLPSNYKVGAPGQFEIGGITGDVDRGYTEAPEVGIQYWDGDQLYPAAWDPARILAEQQKLKDAGLYPKGYKPTGIWDQVSQDAMERVMKYANQAGITKEDVISRWKQYAPDPDQAQGYTLQVQNPEDIKAVLQATAAKIIGRSLTPAELDNMRASYSQIDRNAQEQQAAANVLANDGSGTNAPYTPALSAGNYAEQQLRTNFKGEANFVTANQRMHEFYSILGEGAGMGASNG